MNKAILLMIGGTVVLFGGILLVASKSKSQMDQLSSSFSQEDNAVVSDQGIHWHPHLTIIIKGKEQEIPAHVGIGLDYRISRWYDSMMDMTDIHTHDNSSTLHWEVMAGPVKKGHVKLADFFEIWGKPFNANQILDSKTDEGGTVKMLVNGQPNTEFENYIVKDGDKIEIRYE